MLQLVLFTLGLGLNSGLPRLPLQSSNCLKGLGSICQSHPEYSDVTCKKKNSTVDQHVSPVAGRFSSLPSLFRDIDWIDKTGNLQLTICNFAILHLPIIWKTSSWELHPLSLFSKGMITVSTACLLCNWSYSIYTLFWRIKSKHDGAFHFATKAKRCRNTQYFEKCTNRLVREMISAIGNGSAGPSKKYDRI